VCEDGGVRVHAKPMTASEEPRMTHGAIAERRARRRGFLFRGTHGKFALDAALHWEDDDG
jgi:hypothetical protein